MMLQQQNKQYEYMDSIISRAKKGLEKNMNFQESYRLSNHNLMQGAITGNVPMIEKGLIYGLIALSIHKSKEKEDEI